MIPREKQVNGWPATCADSGAAQAAHLTVLAGYR
jgi:hypothetical protein